MHAVSVTSTPWFHIAYDSLRDSASRYRLRSHAPVDTSEANIIQCRFSNKGRISSCTGSTPCLVWRYVYKFIFYTKISSSRNQFFSLIERYFSRRIDKSNNFFTGKTYFSSKAYLMDFTLNSFFNCIVKIISENIRECNSNCLRG